ncbi:MAG: NrtA/SsuA/CpmA family ABC transporter substrate-binding protein, partial [Desulfatiglandales bacterium]
MMKIMLLVSALFLTGQAGCSGEGERHSPKEHVNTVIAVTPWPASAGLYVAQEKGYFKDEGLDVAFHSYISGHLGLDAAISGKAHFVTVGDTPIARAVIEGKPVAVVATLCEINRAVLIVARKDRGILSPEDLRGKRIGVVVGTTADFFLNIFLTTSYIPRTEVRIVGLETEEVVNALARGEVDAVSTWFPHTLAASDRLGDKGIVQETQRKDRVVHRIITGMNELGGLVGEYALYREERPLQQFLIEHDFILRLIESLG